MKGLCTICLFEDRVPDQKFDFLQATALIKDICTNIRNAANSVGNIDYTVVLRGDSTLRGHFPEASTLNFKIHMIIELGT